MPERPPALVVTPGSHAGDLAGWPGEGWTRVELGGLPPTPFDLSPCRLVVHAAIGEASAASVLLAAARGVAVCCVLEDDGDWADAFVDDLGRIAVVAAADTDADAGQSGLDPDEAALLAALAAGATVGEAARRLGMSRRTATRRVAAALRRLGAASTAAAVRRRRAGR